MKHPTTLRVWLTIALVALAALGITVNVFTGEDGSTTITVKVKGPSGPTTVTAPEPAVEALEEDRHHDGAANERPEGIPLEKLIEGEAQREAFAERDQLPLTTPDAAPQTPGCNSRFIRTNYSSRGRVKPRLIVLHITVSPDRGQSGVNANTAWFANPAARVSSHYIVSGDGHCNYVVREVDNAWTQAAYNRLSLSIEITATQSQGYLLRSGGHAKVSRLVAGMAKRWGIPIRRGAVNNSNCTVTRSGIVDHVQLGKCGGNHSDINPYRGQIPKIIKTAAKVRTSSANDARKIAKWCRSLRITRAQVRDGRTTPQRRSRARSLKTLLINRGAPCV